MSHELTLSELNAEHGELLPAREALSTFSLKKIVKVVNVGVSNNALALVASSKFSDAYVGQGTYITVNG